MHILEVKASLPSSWECQELTADLLRAYSRWADKKNYSVRLAKDDQSECGVKHAIAFIDGDCSEIEQHSGIFRVLKLSSMTVKEIVAVHQSTLSIYPATSKRGLEINYDRKPAGPGGCVYRPDCLNAKSSDSSVILERRKTWISAENDAAIILNSRVDQRLYWGSRITLKARYHPLTNFYCTWVNHAQEASEQWTIEQLTNFWDGDVCHDRIQGA